MLAHGAHRKASGKVAGRKARAGGAEPWEGGALEGSPDEQ